MTKQTDFEFRLFDYAIFNEKQIDSDSEDDSDEEPGTWKKRTDSNQFVIQMFGIDAEGKTASIQVNDYNPFFYVKVCDKWQDKHVREFKEWIATTIGPYYKPSIVSMKLVDRKKLYGFDGGITHKFIEITVKNTGTMNKIKNLWYEIKLKPYSKRLFPNGMKYQKSPGKKYIQIYEGNIPPLLRYFHVNQISPSGWIRLKNCSPNKFENTTSCCYEFNILQENIISLNEKEDIVPFKICSFDIEASSSHGDFPLPVKTYKKLATNIIDRVIALSRISQITASEFYTMNKSLIIDAFTQEELSGEFVDKVFPKRMPTQKQLESMIVKFEEQSVIIEDDNDVDENIYTIEKAFEEQRQQAQNNIDSEFMAGDENLENIVIDSENPYTRDYEKKTNKIKGDVKSIFDIATGSLDRESKIQIFTRHFSSCGFPKLKGDEVTFIGSTFMKYGEPAPYKNTCIALGDCDDVDGEGNEPIITCKTEKDVLLKWTELIQREDPDIIIGYNIFGFDYRFMFERSKENNCEEEFLRLSRNKDEICGNQNREGRYTKIEETSLVIASGQHDLYYIKMNGRLQIDLYNYFRRDYNLTSYKLDYVSGYFIGDGVKEITNDEVAMTHTIIKSKNLTGLLVGSFINFEEIGHSSEYYSEGKKFEVIGIDHDSKTFTISGDARPDMNKKVKWGLAKDDVSPQDIFRMTNEGSKSKAVIAKYCIQDCNLVHYLLNKIDVITGFIEMAKICSVPMNFLVMRGQGIKLTSYIAKKCREKNTLMPDIEKGGNDGGYEGAIVLPPKSGLYLDNPVACVDYSSLYPSSMISENLSHDSKVWTKEYNLSGDLIKETGEKCDETGEYKYDNLPGYKYVDVKYDTYRYVRKTPAAAATKIISGYKICRWAQFPNDEKAIMPSILKELLAARKATRKLIPQQKDEFMKNILDKRQLSYKVTANSLYGQCGAKTSTFYEKDVAASTTATGRKLLTYAKRLIEEVYGDVVCDTKYGKVHSKAEYIYGDTDSVFFTFNLEELDGTKIRGQKALDITIDLAKEAGELATQYLKAPHDLEYEKTFMPFALLSKKRYVGMLYEEDPNVCFRKSMGIVLKRRDNAPIVKDVYGGIIDILMKEKNIDAASKFLEDALKNIVDEKYPIDKLIITKSLRGHYKNPQQIAHKVLADRIGKRDPGNKPSSGDRIPFVYIKTTNKKALQGEKIETPNFIAENKLKPDYAHYITNQIMKPVLQVFALPNVLETLPNMRTKALKKKQLTRETHAITSNIELSAETVTKKVEALRNKYVQQLLFDKYIKQADITSTGVKTLNSFF